VGKGLESQWDEILALDETALSDSVEGSRRRTLIRRALSDRSLWVIAMGAERRQLAGYAIFDYQFHGRGIFRHVHIAIPHRRKGLGFDLVDAIQAHSTGERVFAELPEDNLAGLRLFTAAGFRVAGSVDHLHFNGARHLILVHYLFEATPETAVAPRYSSMGPFLQ
jgi:ribosomal protein S18 acetylase RimI-like enzyme